MPFHFQLNEVKQCTRSLVQSWLNQMYFWSFTSLGSITSSFTRSIKVEVIISIIYTSPLWRLQQKILLNLLAWLPCWTGITTLGCSTSPFMGLAGSFFDLNIGCVIWRWSWVLLTQLDFIGFVLCPGVHLRLKPFILTTGRVLHSRLVIPRGNRQLSPQPDAADHPTPKKRPPSWKCQRFLKMLCRIHRWLILPREHCTRFLWFEI